MTCVEERVHLLFVPGTQEDAGAIVNTVVTAFGGSSRALIGESVSVVTAQEETDLADQLKNALKEKGVDCYVTHRLTENCNAVVVGVDGMTCNSCVRLIETALPDQLFGVNGVRVSLTRKVAFVEFDPSQTSPDKICSSIYDMGFDTEVHKVFPVKSSPASLDVVTTETGRKEIQRCVISVSGMVCQSCVKNIESNVGNAEGVEEVKVSLQDGTATILFRPSFLSVAQLCEAIEDLGFDASLDKNKKHEEKKEKSGGTRANQLSPEKIKVKGQADSRMVSLKEQGRN